MTWSWEPTPDELSRLEKDVEAMFAWGRGVEEVRAELARKGLAGDRAEALIQRVIGARAAAVVDAGKRDVCVGAGLFIVFNGVAAVMFHLGRFGGIAAFVALSFVGVGLAARGLDRLRRKGQAS